MRSGEWCKSVKQSHDLYKRYEYLGLSNCNKAPILHQPMWCNSSRPQAYQVRMACKSNARKATLGTAWLDAQPYSDHVFWVQFWKGLVSPLPVCPFENVVAQAFPCHQLSTEINVHANTTKPLWIFLEAELTTFHREGGQLLVNSTHQKTTPGHFKDASVDVLPATFCLFLSWKCLN